MKETVVERFWRKTVKLESGCWEHSWDLNSRGYGRMYINRKHVLAHRYSWFLATGKAPEKQVLHKCDNPPCVNPDHLFEGDQSLNMRDRALKGKQNTGKLSHTQVRDIFRRRRDGETLSSIARDYGIHLSMVWAIGKRTAWPDLTQEMV